MTFETLLAELRAGNFPNATQNEILLALVEAIKGLQDGYDYHERELQLGRKIGAVKR